MAFTTVVGVGGGLSPAIAASSASSSAPSILRAGGGSRPRGLRRFVKGERAKRWNRLLLRCANEVNVVAEDDNVIGSIEDEPSPDAETNDAVDTYGDSTDELESSSPDAAASVAWITQQPLPYPSDALEPYMSRETVDQHWGIHQHMHVERLNGMIDGSEWEGMSLGEMMLSSFNEGREPPRAPFFHAAQIWNHDFFWRSMKPGGGGKPPEQLQEFIKRDFGSYDRMIQQFMDAALTQFGSGWVWLCYKGSRLPHVDSRSPIPSDNYGRLVISKTPNAVNPLVWGHSPLLAIDVWEHAYYLDYENRRADYVSTFLEKLVSWEMVESRLQKAVVRAVERDSHIGIKQLRKQHSAQAKSLSRIRPRLSKGDAREQGSGQSRSPNQQASEGVTVDH